ncbi:hypothetical protein [Streptomyces sp. SID9727]|uniref:WXG100 family type VII secretion target n=1 Tax=Streptomyces sp. SID9727 TaxID=2706114 RepID=UPI0013CD2D50|nr:hypothetical protein [Streptomyces sp. SID9727]NEC68516.1 hypothetical protein [Streptomyces sp. SID9727]
MGDQGKLPPLNGHHATTDFENMPLEAMLSLIRGADPASIMGSGTALIDAQTEIEKIGTELKAHVSRTTWKGKGGDAFREWGDDFAKETLKLADYAGAAGSSLQTAGQALSEVSTALQGHSDVTSECYADVAKEKARLEAVEKARNEAIPQMNKLASYYMMALETISAQEEPQFKPLPDAALPEMPVGGGQERYGSPAPNTGGTPPDFGAVNTGVAVTAQQPVTAQPVDGTTSPVTSVPATTPHAVSTPQAVTATPAPLDTTGTNIDTVTMPQATPSTVTPPTGGPPSLPVSGGGGPTPIPPVALPSPTGPFGPRGPRVTPVPPVGRGGAPSVRPPAVPRADPAIHGGTPARPVTGPVAGGPRGTVIGSETPVTGRGMMGGHGVGPVGSPMGRGVGAGASRRLVTEPGGTVGTPRGTGAAREFTPGGTGLVRGAGMGAMGPMGGAQTARRRPRRDGGASPDYLTEDEETWATGDGVVPPVID